MKLNKEKTQKIIAVLVVMCLLIATSYFIIYRDNNSTKNIPNNNNTNDDEQDNDNDNDDNQDDDTDNTDDNDQDDNDQDNNNNDNQDDDNDDTDNTDDDDDDDDDDQDNNQDDNNQDDNNQDDNNQDDDDDDDDDTEPTAFPKINITSPKKGKRYYLGHESLLNTLFKKRTIIFGKTTIEVDVEAEAGVEKVEFYIEGKNLNQKEWLEIKTDEPYKYEWTNISLGIYNITVTVYDKENRIISDSIEVIGMGLNLSFSDLNFKDLLNSDRLSTFIILFYVLFLPKLLSENNI